MFFRREKPKIFSELEQLRDDDNLSHIVKPLLQQYRQTIAKLARVSKQGGSLQLQEKLYQDICTQEKYVTKFGHVFVIESKDPFAFCMTKERYKKYLGIKNSKRYFRDAFLY